MDGAAGGSPSVEKRSVEDRVKDIVAEGLGVSKDEIDGDCAFVDDASQPRFSTARRVRRAVASRYRRSEGPMDSPAPRLIVGAAATIWRFNPINSEPTPRGIERPAFHSHVAHRPHRVHADAGATLDEPRRELRRPIRLSHAAALCARIGDGSPLRLLPDAGSRSVQETAGGWTRCDRESQRKQNEVATSRFTGAVICSAKGVRSLLLDAA